MIFVVVIEFTQTWSDLDVAPAGKAVVFNKAYAAAPESSPSSRNQWAKSRTLYGGASWTGGTGEYGNVSAAA